MLSGKTQKNKGPVDASQARESLPLAHVPSKHMARITASRIAPVEGLGMAAQQRECTLQRRPRQPAQVGARGASDAKYCAQMATRCAPWFHARMTFISAQLGGNRAPHARTKSDQTDGLTSLSLNTVPLADNFWALVTSTSRSCRYVQAVAFVRSLPLLTRFRLLDRCRGFIPALSARCIAWPNLAVTHCPDTWFAVCLDLRFGCPAGLICHHPLLAFCTDTFLSACVDLPLGRCRFMSEGEDTYEEALFEPRFWQKRCQLSVRHLSSSLTNALKVYVWIWFFSDRKTHTLRCCRREALPVFVSGCAGCYGTAAGGG